MNSRLIKGCALPRSAVESVQNGTMRYLYRGVPTLKSPFDLALYQMLFWERRPKTLIEIGSKFGGSALWFADLMRTYGIEPVIHSVDITPPEGIRIPGVTFTKGDGRDLGATFSDDLLASLPRPLIVIEDADHHPATTLAVLKFFDRWLRKDEYIIVEDGIVDDLFDADRMAALEGGPRPAIAEFLSARGVDYEIDARLCDFYGVNVTWNVNGFLRRTR